MSAAKLKILETGVLHASDVIYWLDGTSAESVAEMQRLSHALKFELSAKPGDVKVRQAPGKTVFWRNQATTIISGEATENDKSFVDGGSYSLTGTVYDTKGYYNPRTFSVTLGASTVPIGGQGMIVYPTPLGTRFGKGGGLIASLRFASDERLVVWALLSAVVTVPGVGSQTYRAQTDRHGDVLLPLHRLPPLPEGLTEYSVALSVEASLTATPEEPLNTGDLVPMDLESPSVAGSFANPITFAIVPNEIQAIRSANKRYLAVQTS
ncbi:MAG: hypothetical protein QNJ17_00455 [Desulfocapsaceae bacterium]|nr:hypothetical protein [Desulfocapsaceae bacterium]